MEEDKGGTTDLTTALSGSNLDGLAFRAISEYGTGLRHRLRLQIAEKIVRESF